MQSKSFEDLSGKTAVLTGGAGIIGSVLCNALAAHGVKTAVLDLNKAKACETAEQAAKATGTNCIGVETNVLERGSLEAVRATVETTLGPVDFLINCAGGNHPAATTAETVATPSNHELGASLFHGLDIQGIRKVFDLNIIGTILPTQVFAESMCRRMSGCIVNVSSMNAFRPLTKIAAYSAAKAAVTNLTAWLAVHYAKVNIRVNAIAPGFLLTDQNRFLLVDKASGEMTPRGKTIVDHTPMGRYGEPEEIAGPMLFLLSDMARFITGVVLPIDGGFSAFSGV